MAKLDEIVARLDSLLEIVKIPDYPGAQNGLQLAGRQEVRKVAAAVDASLPVVRDAVAAGADLLVVHHGLFWSGAQPIVGGLYEKLKLAMDAGLGVYSCHIPLDVHPRVGNNALLAEALGLEAPEPFFDWKGIKLGLKAAWPGTREALAARLGDVLGSPVHVCAGRREAAAGVVGVITGGAGSEVNAIAAQGIDTFVTGEGPHWSYTAAQELFINILYGGHYATETFGVRAVVSLLAGEFGVGEAFLDHPTGL